MKRLIGLFVVVVLVTTACGGDGSDESSGAAAAGRQIFSTTCQACHGPDGEGVTDLGSDLTTSSFVRDTADADLVAFLEVGRSAEDPANITGVGMPAKGGRTTLTTDDLSDVVAYLRTINS